MANTDLFSIPKGLTQNDEPKDIYKPNPKLAKDGIYRSVVRFIPYYKDVDRSCMKKLVAWLRDPDTGSSKPIDDPRTVGDRSDIGDWFFKLWGTKNVKYQDFAKKHLGSSWQYSSIVQIINDDQRPELNGKLMVFKYGKTIFDKIELEKNGSVSNEPMNPFHPIYGRYFSIVCSPKGDYTTMEQSSFFDNKENRTILPSGMFYQNANGDFVQVDETTTQDDLMTYLENNTPDMDRFDYHEWSSDDESYVNTVLAKIAERFANGTIGMTPESVIGMKTMNPAGVSSAVGGLFKGATKPSPTQSSSSLIDNSQSTPSAQRRQVSSNANGGMSAKVTGIEVPTVGSANHASKDDMYDINGENIDAILGGM